MKEVFLLFAVTSLGLCASPAQNLLVNGDFEAGNTGFTTDYYYSHGNVWWQDWYDVAQSPIDCHIGGADFRDHTSGTGLMLVMNGGSDTSLDLWKETVTVSPNRTYAFSGWSATWGHDPYTTFDPNPPQLAVYINGVQQGGTIQVVAENGQWRKFTVFWDSQSATEAVIEVKDCNNAYTGNDLALDDLSFSDVLVNSSVYSSVEISWQSEPNKVYEVQWSPPPPASPTWEKLGEQVEAQGTTVSIWDRVQPGSRSYKVFDCSATLLNCSAPQNLLQNGNFENGTAGFTTYYKPTTTHSIWDQGFFAIAQNPKDFHPAGVDMSDHTSRSGQISGLGNMFIANGVSYTTAWSETIDVQPNHTYLFSGWCAGVTTTYPIQACIELVVFGRSREPAVSPALGVWTPIRVYWDSGSTPRGDLILRDTVGTKDGNDFALDDLSVIDVSVDAQVYPSSEVFWDSDQNGVYQVQWAPTSSSSTWNNLGSPVSAQGTTVSVWDRVPQGTRSYRVLRLQ